MVPPLRNGTVGAFSDVCLNLAYHRPDHGIWKWYFILAEGTLKWRFLLVPKWP